MRGKTSGVDLSQMPAQGAQVFGIRDGKVARIDGYWIANADSPISGLRRRTPRTRSRFRDGAQSRRADGIRRR